MKTKLFLLTLAMAIFCGCSSSYSISTSPYQLAIGKKTYISNYRVIQTIDTHFALAVDSRIVDYPFVIAIKSSVEHAPFYDGQIITGSFVMIDTYTYETVPDKENRTFVKTVPLVIPKNEYNEK